MGKIAQLIPINLVEEKDKFFNSKDYNPQFSYSSSIDVSFLNQYGQPTQKIEAFVQKMLQKYGPPDFSKNGKVLTQFEIEEKINSLLSSLELPNLSFFYSNQFSARIMLSKKGLHIRTPISLDSNDIQQILDHEIQTHYLRRINHSHQIWKDHYPKNFINSRITEEGLALLNTYQSNPQPFTKQFLTTAGECVAQKKSFRTVFDFFKQYNIEDQIAWNLTMKLKRGLTDTSLPGGLAKSHIYLEGAVKVSKWIIENHNKINLLFAGKLSLDDIAEINNNSLRYQKITLPLFVLDKSSYVDSIITLSDINQLID